MAHATTRLLEAMASSMRRHAKTLATAVSHAKKADPRAVHRARVTTRRLREILPVAVAAAAQDDRKLARDLKRLTKALGPVRELDVARAVLANLAVTERWPADAVARVDRRCARLRIEAHARATASLDGLEARSLRRRLENLADRAQTGKAAAAWSVLTARLRDRARALEDAIDEAGTVYAATPLHATRIAAKKLRYAVELVGEAAPAAARSLKKVQTRLGHLHDAQILQRCIQAAAAETADAALVTALGAMDRVLEVKCRQWHGQIVKAWPRLRHVSQVIGQEVPRRLGPRELGRPARIRATAAQRRRARVA